MNQRTIMCDYGVATLSLNDNSEFELQNILKLFPEGQEKVDKILFLILPDSSLPDASTEDAFKINLDANSISWSFLDSFDGKKLIFQIGSTRSPLEAEVMAQIKDTGFIPVAFVNTNTGAPRHFAAFVKETN